MTYKHVQKHLWRDSGVDFILTFCVKMRTWNNQEGTVLVVLVIYINFHVHRWSCTLLLMRQASLRRLLLSVTTTVPSFFSKRTTSARCWVNGWLIMVIGRCFFPKIRMGYTANLLASPTVHKTNSTWLNIKKHCPGSYNMFLEPQTTIYKWLFQLDDSQSLRRKWSFHQTSI